ncbi:MAG TPA: glycosyltransferase family 2 protein [Chitinophagales bacterium]|nr:glycosyltransferase family 2 protein [Chitinophagales bacterium]
MQPFFSVVIPTKNRPYYLRQAIQSVLWQDFDDFELIVSDNYNNEETQQVIDEFSAHPNFKSFRTDQELNMLNHWEWATRKAEGKYVLVLTDRKLFFQHSLKKLNNIVRVNHEAFNLYSFGVRLFDEDRNRIGYSVPKRKSRVFTSKELIENFLHENLYLPGSYDFFFPKTLNSCYRNEYAAKLRSQFGIYFNTPGVITPDFSSFFINMALNEAIFYYAEYLVLTQGEKLSTGRLLSKGKYEPFLRSLHTNDPFELLPLKIPSSYNMVVNDFLYIKELFGNRLSSLQLDWENYFVTNYTDLLFKKFAGVEDTFIHNFEEDFKNALTQLDPALQRKITERTGQIELYIGQRKKRVWKKETLILHAKDFFYERLKGDQRLTNLLRLTYANPLKAAGFRSNL